MCNAQSQHILIQFTSEHALLSINLAASNCQISNNVVASIIKRACVSLYLACSKLDLLIVLLEEENKIGCLQLV